MFSTLVSVALFFTLAFRSVYADFTISTPSLVQCEKVQVTWSKAAGPYDLVVAPVSDPCDKVLVDLGGNHQSTSLTWLVNIPAGTQAVFSLLDANGDEAWSGPMTVKAGNDSSCLTASSSSSPSGSASPSASGQPAVGSPATTLVVPPSSASAKASESAAVPVGAANAGLNPTSGALALRQINTPLVALGTVAAIIFSLTL